jgi:putative SOS response-associated peptidase YedK
MCGRYSLSLKGEKLEKRFNAKLLEKFKPRYNAAPSQNLPVITNLDPESIQFYQWGLVPYWSKDALIGNKLINARSETLFEKPSFQQSIRDRRCLIPADGFFEWKKNGKTRTPHRIHLRNKKVFSMAGLWDSWEISAGKKLNSFTIITTKANSLIKELHERMPVILPPENEGSWLNEDLSREDIQALLIPFEAEQMDYYPVSTEINRVENDNLELIKPAESNPPGKSLPLFS